MECIASGISGAEVVRLIPSLLADGDSRLEAATSIVRRLQASVDDACTARSILRLLCANCNGESFLVELLLELVQFYAEPVHIINIKSVAAASSSEENIEKIIEVYKDLVVQVLFLSSARCPS